MPPTGICCIFCILPPCHSQGFAVYFKYFSHATHRKLLCIPYTSPTPSTGICYVFCILLRCHPQRFTAYSAYFSLLCTLYFSNTTHKDLLCILYTSPTTPTGIYCVVYKFSPCHPQGFAVYSVYFSRATHKDSLCILPISPMPPTGICFAFCILFLAVYIVFL